MSYATTLEQTIIPAQLDTEPSYHSLNAMLATVDENGLIPFDAERRAVKQYFLNNINLRMRFFHTLEEKLKYLIQNDYYESETFEMYSASFVKKAFKLAYSYKFRFRTYKGAKKFYSGYALKTNDRKNYLERFEDRVTMVALVVSQGDETLALQAVRDMMMQRVQPATPTFANAGKKHRGELVSCYLKHISDDMENIAYGAAVSALQLSKRGGGVAYCLTDVRGQKAPIKRMAGMASGLVPVAKSLDVLFNYANQLGTRDGSGAVYVHAMHPDAMTLLDSKRENADPMIRLQKLSIGLVVPTILYQLAKNNDSFYTFEPYDVFREYQVPLSRINVTKNYWKLVNNPRIAKKKLNARSFLKEVAKIQFESGYPYIMHEDIVNDNNPIHGYITQSNLCVAPETMLLTDEGEFRIADLNGKRANVWNGKQWTNALVMRTNDNEHLIRVHTSNAKSLDATEYHKWYVQVGDKLVMKRTTELMPNDQLVTWSDPHTNASVNASVVLIEDHGRRDATYCVAETIRNMAVFNGILTGNCVEILQVSTPTFYHEDGSFKTIGKDISCNLASLNAVRCLNEHFSTTVSTGIQLLSNVSDISNIRCDSPISYGNSISHSVGLGVMNLHGLFAKHKIFYGSEESIDLTSMFFCALNYHSIRASCEIAKRRGVKFHEFELSKYATGEYFDKYVDQEWLPTTNKVKKILSDAKFFIPTTEDWDTLRRDVQQHGMYNQYRLAVAPTGSISYINDSTPSIHPAADRIEARKEGMDGLTYYPAPELTNDNVEYFQNAYEIGWKKTIDVHAAAAPHVDQSISMTLFFDENATTRTIGQAQVYAHYKGLKTIYYVRVRGKKTSKMQADISCVACAV